MIQLAAQRISARHPAWQRVCGFGSSKIDGISVRSHGLLERAESGFTGLGKLVLSTGAWKSSESRMFAFKWVSELPTTRRRGSHEDLEQPCRPRPLT
jgi:hypothetical protein